MPCKIRFLSDTVESKKHDKKLADETQYTLPDGSKLLQDTGFQGFTLDNVAILQPKKKPKGKPLSDLDKLTNPGYLLYASVSNMPLAGSNAIELLKTKFVVGNLVLRMLFLKLVAAFIILD